jgi:hypothetical protein
MFSNFLRLDLSDLGKGLFIAVLAVVLGALQQAVTKYGYDFASYDWASILDLAVKAAGLYLTKNLLSTSDGTPLGLSREKVLGGFRKKV